MSYKYPYIPKEYYPAVMYACSLIRKYGTFNRAIRSAANKYDLDEDEIEKHVRKRQGAGQKGSTRKYKYYLVIGYTDYWINTYDVDILFSQYEPEKWEKERQMVHRIIKATSVKNAEKQIPKGSLDRDFRMRGNCISRYRISEYDTMEEAKKAATK